MVIAPKVYVTPDRPTIRFKEPRERIDLDKEVQRILKAQGWGLGTYFNVQFVSHDETELLYQNEYVVSKDLEQFQTSDDERYNTTSRTVHIREFICVGNDSGDLKEAITAIIDGVDKLEESMVNVVQDGTDCNEQIGNLNNRVVTLEEKRKPGPKPKVKPEGE